MKKFIVFLVIVGVIGALYFSGQEKNESRNNSDTGYVSVHDQLGLQDYPYGTVKEPVYDIPNTYTYPSDNIGSTSVKTRCTHCHGSGDCAGCHGTGVISQTKNSIDLGSGSSEYTIDRKCGTCGGTGRCIWCNGTGEL